MSWTSDFKFRIQITALALAVVGSGFAIWQALQARREMASTHWPSVVGAVSAIDLQREEEKNEVRFFGRVTYRYTVDGTERTANRISFDAVPRHRDQLDALQDVRHFKDKEPVRVFYDPQDPSAAVLQPGVPSSHLGLLIGFSVAAAVGLLATAFFVPGWIAAWRDWHHLRREAANAPPVVLALAPSEKEMEERQLGATIGVFRPALENVIAGFILSLLMVVAAVVELWFYYRKATAANWNLPLQHDKDLSWLSLGFLALVGFGLIIGAYFLARYAKGLLSRRVEICADGLRCRQDDVDHAILWTEVARIVDIIHYQRVATGVIGMALPKKKVHEYAVVTTWGKTYSFDANSVRGITKLGGVLRDRSNTLALPLGNGRALLNQRQKGKASRCGPFMDIDHLSVREKLRC